MIPTRASMLGGESGWVDHWARVLENGLRLARETGANIEIACHDHTSERTHPDVTIQACWDSKRLDPGRVGVTPHPSRLCTDTAKRPEMIKWSDGRTSFRVVPAFVWEEWGIELEPLT
jgi:hypothetical protein